jgi:DNA-binding transcriptional MerR regulator
MEKDLPPIPAKRYFTIGEVGDLCGVKPHVLRYWEQEFTQLRPMKRRGNRRYYQHHEVLMIRRIRELLYDQGFTISGARNKLQELVQVEREKRTGAVGHLPAQPAEWVPSMERQETGVSGTAADVHASHNSKGAVAYTWQAVKKELMEIRSLLAEQF